MQTLDFVSGLHNCLEFSQPLSCLNQAMQTRKCFLLLNYICGWSGAAGRWIHFCPLFFPLVSIKRSCWKGQLELYLFFKRRGIKAKQNEISSDMTKLPCHLHSIIVYQHWIFSLAINSHPINSKCFEDVIILFLLIAQSNFQGVS